MTATDPNGQAAVGVGEEGAVGGEGGVVVEGGGVALADHGLDEVVQAVGGVLQVRRGVVPDGGEGLGEGATGRLHVCGGRGVVDLDLVGRVVRATTPSQNAAVSAATAVVVVASARGVVGVAARRQSRRQQQHEQPGAHAVQGSHRGPPWSGPSADRSDRPQRTTTPALAARSLACGSTVVLAPPDAGPSEAGLAVRTCLVTLPALMQPVQTLTRFGEPSTTARIFWMFGFQRRLVRRCEWLTFIPNDGCFPQTSHTAAMTTNLDASGPAV